MWGGRKASPHFVRLEEAPSVSYLDISPSKLRENRNRTASYSNPLADFLLSADSWGNSLPVAAFATGEITHGTQEVNTPESRPVDIDERVLRICGLPEQEA